MKKLSWLSDLLDSNVRASWAKLQRPIGLLLIFALVPVGVHIAVRVWSNIP